MWSPRHHGKTLGAYELFQYRSNWSPVPRPRCQRRCIGASALGPAKAVDFTLMIEALVMLLQREMPVDAMADLLDEPIPCLGGFLDALSSGAMLTN